MMLAEPKIRTVEQKLRKMLNEENMIMGLELAIKKEQFRKSQNTKQRSYEASVEGKGGQMSLVSTHEANGYTIQNSFLEEIGF